MSPEINDSQADNSSQGGWIMTQKWLNLAFFHWNVPADLLLSRVPPGLILDTFDGKAWLGITPFSMEISPRGIPLKLKYNEINVRTYVLADGVPGVLFLSLDINGFWAVVGARLAYALPYHQAGIKVERENSAVHFNSLRQSQEKEKFKARYEPVSGVFKSSPESLEYFLTERYYLYVKKRRELFRARIHHVPWPLQEAAGEVIENSLFVSSALNAKPPIVHYSDELSVLVWPLEKLKEKDKNAPKQVRR